MLKGRMWKHDTIQMKKKKLMKALMGFEPVHNGKINVCSATSDSIFWAIQDDIKQLSKLHLTTEYASLLFWFQCLQNKQM